MIDLESVLKLQSKIPESIPESSMTEERFCQLGKAVIRTEVKAIASLEERIDHHFSQACALLHDCKGRIVVLGMGKSGHIGRKIASTLASTGTPAFFVHPGEASHGDMGMVISQDLIIALSYSGDTPEIINLLPALKRLGVQIIAITGKPQSVLASAATVHLDISVQQEACPLGLAPTASSTAALVMGDALAIALLEVKGFTAEDFAFSHPGGILGRRLLLKIDNLMHKGISMPLVSENCLLSDALLEITKKRLGMTTIVNDKGCLLGVFTDGDLRRTLDKSFDIRKTIIREVMSKNCITLRPNHLAEAALQIMEAHKITSIVVVDDEHHPLGVIHIHDLLQARVA